ncbi:hypothetical protein GCM10009839_19900 [Catenulispora yoronensis]|uniref:N-acetyltransferase domain-containing protein n=1 Tax=Catenulispora yoronensis TaxID=450799 RepID=A0ABP5FDH6_9ACTN
MELPAGVRHYTSADEAEVARIFRETLCLGRPLDFPLSGMDRYQRLCLDWFLRYGSDDIGVYEEDGRVHGYVLVCTDLASYHRWAARTALAWTTRVVFGLAFGRLRHQDARFHRLRLRDGWTAALHAPSAPMPALVHVNLDRSARNTGAAQALLRFADQRCATAGHEGWFAEINTRSHRASALAAIGLHAIHSQPSHTLSWLLEEHVNRLTVVHSVGEPIGRASAAPAAAASNAKANAKASVPRSTGTDPGDAQELLARQGSTSEAEQPR